MGSYAALVTVANANGGTLKATPAEMGITWVMYSVLDTDPVPDGTMDSYALWVTVNGVPATGYAGQVIRLSPEGITRCAAGSVAPTTCN